MRDGGVDPEISYDHGGELKDRSLELEREAGLNASWHLCGEREASIEKLADQTLDPLFAARVAVERRRLLRARLPAPPRALGPRRPAQDCPHERPREARRARARSPGRPAAADDTDPAPAGRR